MVIKFQSTVTIFQVRKNHFSVEHRLKNYVENIKNEFWTWNPEESSFWIKSMELFFSSFDRELLKNAFISFSLWLIPWTIYFKIIIYFKIYILTRRLSGFEILNNETLIFQKWLISRHFANIFHYLNFSEEYLWQFS